MEKKQYLDSIRHIYQFLTFSVHGKCDRISNSAKNIPTRLANSELQLWQSL